MLAPDNGETLGKVEISITRLDDYCRANGIDVIDFLKIEAEGVEPEVFAGLGSVTARKIAIDVSEERNGQSPAPEFWETLPKMGYELKQRGHVLFARLVSEF